MCLQGEAKTSLWQTPSGKIAVTHLENNDHSAGKFGGRTRWEKHDEGIFGPK